MRIQGAGTIRGDNTSFDIHLELTSINDPQPTTPSTPAPASVQSTEQARGPTAAKYQQDIPLFGVETGKRIYITTRDVK